MERGALSQKDPPTPLSYLYCLLSGPSMPDLTALPDGLPGAGPPRLLPLDSSCWLLVAAVPADEYGQERIDERIEDLEWVSERAVAHQRVIAHFVGAATIIPMKLFTIFASDERALEHIRGDRERIDAILERVRDRVEIGVRVDLDREGARARAERAADEPGETGVGPGTAFLLGRKARRDVLRDAVATARTAAADYLEGLARVADESFRPPESSPESALVAEASFLVGRDRVPEFEAEADAGARRLGELSCVVTLTGPWPPYAFAEPRRP